MQKKILKDVRKWSEEFLEIPNKHLGGMPACPFAKKTWKDNKVVVEMYRLLNYVANNIKLNGLDNDTSRQSLGGIIRNLAEGFMD